MEGDLISVLANQRRGMFWGQAHAWRSFHTKAGKARQRRPRKPCSFHLDFCLSSIGTRQIELRRACLQVTSETSMMEVEMKIAVRLHEALSACHSTRISTPPLHSLRWCQLDVAEPMRWKSTAVRLKRRQAV